MRRAFIPVLDNKISNALYFAENNGQGRWPALPRIRGLQVGEQRQHVVAEKGPRVVVKGQVLASEVPLLRGRAG